MYRLGRFIRAHVRAAIWFRYTLADFAVVMRAWREARMLGYTDFPLPRGWWNPFSGAPYISEG